MNKLLCCILFLLLCCCSSVSFHNSYFFDYKFLTGIVYAENTNIDVFWEWGLLRITGEKLHVFSGMENAIDSVMSRELFCPSSSNMGETFIGAKIYENIREPNYLNIDCLYEMNLTDKKISSLIKSVFLRAGASIVHIGIDDNDYKIYLKDLKAILNKERHKIKIMKQNISVVCNNHNSCSTYEGTVYELSFKYDDPVYSFSFITDSKKYKGYNLLKMDSSLLPLESPKYKALKQAENMRID